MIKKNVKVYNYIEKVIDGISYNTIKDKKKFVEDIDNMGFFTSPCSRKYHGNYFGGLAEHSLNVYNELYNLNFDNKLNLTYDQVAIMGLFHDIEKSDKYIVKDGIIEYKNAEFMHHGSNSVIKLMELNVNLDDIIKHAITHHMGSFDPNYIQNVQGLMFKTKYHKPTMALHLADMIATHLIEHKI